MMTKKELSSKIIRSITNIIMFTFENLAMYVCTLYSQARFTVFLIFRKYGDATRDVVILEQLKIWGYSLFPIEASVDTGSCYCPILSMGNQEVTSAGLASKTV